MPSPHSPTLSQNVQKVSILRFKCLNGVLHHFATISRTCPKYLRLFGIAIAHPIAYNGSAHVPSPKMAPFLWGSGFPSNARFLGPTRVSLAPNGISIGSAVLHSSSAACVVRSRIYALHAGDAVQNYRSYQRTDATRMHGALSAIAEHLCE